jgi:LysM repeat protein
MEFPMLRNWTAFRAWLLVSILVASLAGVPAFAQGSATVRIDPSTSTIQVNETASIAIKVDNIANLIAFEIHLSFDPSVLEVADLTNGGFVAADFEAQNTFDNEAGTIDYAVAQMNRPPAQGSGTLLNISFRAKGNGSSTVTTRATPAAPSGLLFADQNGTALQVSFVPGSIAVGSLTPVANTPTATSSASPPTNTSTAPGSTPTNTATSTPITHTPTITSTSIPTTNTPTRTMTPTAPTPPQAGTPGTHIVRWGEWLYCIARAYRVSPTAIIQANRLWWPYIIFPNQRLTIPNVPWTNMTAGPVCNAQFTFPGPTPTPTVTPGTPVVTTVPPTLTTLSPGVTPLPATTAPSPACRATYVVRRGDTLYRIALRYGTTYMELARVNGISNPRLIYPGQRLCIP